jgi:multicomponent Na+:H+ antiporter subunit E
MNTAFLVVILALVWAGATGNFSGLNLLFGGLIGGVAVLLLRQNLMGGKTLRRARLGIELLLVLLYELVLSAIRVGMVVLQPNIRNAIKPAIVAVPLTVKSDAEITLLANMITLTPGTLSMDVSEDRKVLLVHALVAPDREALIAEIAGGFETRIKELFA